MIQVGVGDVGLEVAIEGLWVAEVEASLEVEVELVVVDVDPAVEAVVVEVAVDEDFVDGVAEQEGVGEAPVNVKV